MKLTVIAVALAVSLGLSGCASTAGSTSNDFEDLLSGGRANGADLERRIQKAAQSPLGSQQNPIRVNMPAGQRAYLSRLRCSDGKAPQFTRVGNFGPGVFGSIIDGYQVVCATGEPKQSMIFMDMYHPTHDEKAAPAGFTIVPN